MNRTPGLEGAHPAWVPTLFGLSQLIEVLSSASREPSRAGRVPLSSLPTGHGGILGAQLLGQMVMLSESRFSGMQVRTAAMRFIRRSSWERRLEARVEVHSEGRRFASATVSFVQDDVEDAGPITDVWSRVPIAAGELQLSRALLAFATEPLTVPLAIDIAGERAAGADIAQSVVSHSISFVRDLDVSSWHLHRARLVADVRGHLTGAGEVLDEQGQLTATTETVALADVTKRTFA